MIDIDETIRRLYKNPYEEQKEEEYRYACYVEGVVRNKEKGRRKREQVIRKR